MKKTILLHLDSLDILDELTYEQSGKLFMKIKSYNEGNVYISDDKLIEILFINFKNQFDRDLQKYDNVCERNKENIEKRYSTSCRNNLPNLPVVESGRNNLPKSTKSTDKENDKDNDKEEDIYTKIYFSNEKLNFEFWEFLKMRKLKRVKNTPHSIDLLLEKLNLFPDNIKIKMVQQSIISGWTGIFEVKNQLNPQSDAFKHKNGTDKKIYLPESVKPLDDSEKQDVLDNLRKLKSSFIANSAI